MASWTTAKVRSGSAAALVGAALIVAGCGSSSGSASSTASAPAAGSSASGTVSQASATGGAIGTAKGAHGTYLVSASGRALYLWVADGSGSSSCSGACAKVWPPVTTQGTPIAGHGAKAGDLGTITRSDGTKQVTYKGHPLYSFIQDTSASATKGQGSDSFGAKWWLVAPAGTAITAGGGSGAAGGGGTSGGRYGGSSSSSSSSSAAGSGY